MSLVNRFRPVATVASRMMPFHRSAVPIANRSFRATPTLSTISYGSNPADSAVIDVDVDRSKEDMDDDVVNAGLQYGQPRDLDLDFDSRKMDDGANIPNYSGPSIAEKKLDRAVNVDDTVHFPTSDQVTYEESGEAVSDSKYHSYSQRAHAKQWEGYANELLQKPNQKNADEFDASQTEMSMNGIWSESSMNNNAKAKKSFNKKGASIFDEIDQKKYFSTRSFNKGQFRGSDGMWYDDDTMTSPDENLSDDISHEMAQVADKARRVKNSAKHATEELAEDVKEVAKEGLNSVKKGAKKVKESVKEAAETVSAAAQSDASTMGEDVNSLRKSLHDGPQDMPQGVGKRAKNEKGKPMETGTNES